MSRILKFPSNGGARDYENARFSSSRLTLARQLRGMTQMGLAVSSGVSARTISLYEHGRVDDPGLDKITALADALQVPLGFFFRGDAPEITPEGVSFRSLARTPARQRDAVCATAAVAVDFDAWIDEWFVRPSPDLPDLQHMDAQTAAEAVRSEWGLGARPVGNMAGLLERRGVRVYGFDPDPDSGFDDRNVNALSTWYTGTPFIFLSSGGTAERRRFTLAHELGHLVMHRHGALAGQRAERDADAFAGAFLVPTADLRANLPRRNLSSIINAKARWQVAAIALVYRMHEEGLLTDWEYKQLCIRIRSTYGRGEPNEGARETSPTLTKMLAEIRQEGFDRGRIAAALDVKLEDLDRLLRPLVMISAPVGADEGDRPPLGLRREK